MPEDTKKRSKHATEIFWRKLWIYIISVWIAVVGALMIVSVIIEVGPMLFPREVTGQFGDLVGILYLSIFFLAILYLLLKRLRWRLETEDLQEDTD